MFKVGDKAKVTKKTFNAVLGDYDFEVGDEVVVTEIYHSDSFGFYYDCECNGYKYAQYILPCDLEMIELRGDTHEHYNKSILGKDGIKTTVDVYRVLEAFNVTNPQLQHIVKKALCAGQRGHKDYLRDLQDIVDSAKNAIEMEKQKGEVNE